ncbi:MAG: molybdenum cofactor guanylyltransferase [Anaerolineales bacterium]|jgi:molybdopterin-guanine dinucleotide biosynthesis protein A
MFSIAIQAGGESERMGQDKALMPFLGEPLIQRVYQRMAPIADEILVTTNNPKDYEFLNVSLHRDTIPNRGALGGLYTALQAASYPIVGVVACDMPFASPELLQAMRDTMQNSELDLFIPQTEVGLEPFHAVYRRETCLAAVKRAIDNDQWRLISWHHEVAVKVFPLEKVVRYDPEGLAFWNLNTPNEFREAEGIARLRA